MRRLRFIIGALTAVLGVAPLSAQQPTGTVRGRVTDETNNQPIARATVAVGNRAALTQQDGTYNLVLPAGSHQLTARLIGYAPATRTISIAEGQTVEMDFALAAQAVSLSEIVVIGYGEQAAGNITGAVSAVGAGSFNPGRVISPQSLIQSKVAGVQVVESNEPGGGMNIRIRGATSITANSEPLYVVDGVPLGQGSGAGLSAGRDALNFLNPNDIENITVLRDASAAAIYGTNAANGVVLITTRSGRGRTGTQFEYSSSASMSSATRFPDMMNAQQFSSAVATYAPTRVDSLLGQNTDWFNLVSRTAYGQEHNLALTNSTGSMGYRLSLGYLDQDGIIRGSNNQRVSLGFNYNQNLFNDRVVVRTNVRGSRSLDTFTPGDVLGNAASMAPTQPVLDPTSRTGYWDWNTTNASPSNPVASLHWASDKGTTLRSLGNAQVEWHVPYLAGLNANMNLGYDITKADRTTFYPNNLAAQVRQGQGSLYMANNSQSNQLLEAYLDYTPQVALGPGTLNLVGGYSYNTSHGDYPFYNASGLTSNLLGDNGIPNALNVSNGRNVVDYKLISFFGRLNYNVGDKYLAGVTLRRDGSSRFGPGNQWGTFPSVALAWRVSQEPFFHGLAGLNDLKLRATWAQTGNQSFGDYLFVPTYTYANNLAQVQFGNEWITTIRPSAVDEFIHWEKTSSVNLGLDYGFGSGSRFTGTVDWYTKNTDDLIFTVPVAAGTNLSNYVTTNIGSMRNRGLEFSLNARLMAPRAHALGWTASFTASHNSNELTQIDPSKSVSRILTGGISGGVGNNIQVFQPGEPIRSFFVYQQRYDAQGQPIYSTLDTAMYVDLDSNGVINDQDRRPFHSPDPTWILGHSSYFTYGSWDASLTLRANLGNYVYNNVASSNGAYQNLSGSGMPSNLHTSVLETGFVTPQYYSDYFVEDASFLRMDNITLGYSFNWQGQPFRVYGTVQNAFTITGYSGVDPTSGLSGIDNNIYPRARTITTGLSVRF